MISINKVPLRLGARLKALRESKNISQEKLAHLAGLNRAYIGYIERGERNPSISTMARISNALQIDLYELFKF